MKKKCLVILLVFSMLLIGFGIVQAFEMQVPAGRQYDFGGQTVKIDAWGIYPHRDIATYGGIKNFYEDPRNQPQLQWVEETFNCKIEFVEGRPGGRGWPEAILPSILAGDAPVDIISYFTGEVMGRSLPVGLFHTLDSFLDEEYFQGKTLLENYPSFFGNYREVIAGRTYNFFGSIGQRFNLEPYFMAYNRDMLAKEGIPDLYDLVDQGKWTWDAFRDIVLAVTKDTDGDGKIDQGAWTFGMGDIHYLVVSNNGKYIGEEDGKMNVFFDRPESLEAFQFISDLKSNLPDDGKNFSNSPTNFIDGKTLWLSSGTALSLAAGGQKFNFSWGIVPFPMGPKADDYKVASNQPIMQYIPITVPNPREVMEVILALNKCTTPYRDIDQYEKEFVSNFIKYAPDTKAVDLLKWGLEQPINEKDGTFTFMKAATVGGNSFNSGLASIFSKGISPKSVLDTFKPAVQQLLDDYFNSGKALKTW